MEEVMPARRHSSAMLSSPRKPSSTRRIFSSAEKWRRVARRMSLTTVSAGAFAGPEVCFIFAPYGYNEPDILRSGKPQLCLTGPDAGHPPALDQQIQDLTFAVDGAPQPHPLASD